MNEKKVQHMFLHVDLDAFFASVEQLDHPEYRGKPVIVGGRPEDRRGVVSTASYEARKYGVHSAMPVYQAYRLCPQGIFVHGNMHRYAELSYQVMSIFKDYSPDVQQMSIDEAIIDLTGTEKLFGPAEKVALEIKERVKKETRLTVSVGLASTQYIAKIASGVSKPDGFYYVHPGDETEFMLGLPLDKIWGAGKKTQELIRSKGFKTTREIYEKDLDLLQFIFGNNLGSFLYNAVRGNEDMSFSRQAKTHSISAETTFPYDITDIYTAETALMELCYGVYFRLLREECFSRTVTLKLRYDDFSTTNAQVTYDRSIITLDSFFEKIKNLFETKYEKGRGIRLLGVGFDNVETEDRPYQQDLFESDNTKKTKIEKAILNLEKKHPEIKVQKARMLKNNIITFIAAAGLLSFFTLMPAKAFAKENSVESKGAASILSETQEYDTNTKIGHELFNWDINQNNSLDFLVSGYWKANFENNVSFNFGNNTPLNISVGIPVFKQEVDISFWATLNKTWTFKAEFADEFTKNTISASYRGKGYLNSALISNRNITMPEFYASNSLGYGISGGDSQSPGFNLHFEDYVNNQWSGDFILRYDMTKSKNATFYGLNNVSDSYISINNFEHSRTFVFPKESWNYLSEIESIYIESKNGTFKDSNGKSYKKITSDQYNILPSSGKLLLSSSALSGTDKNTIPTILIAFTNESSRSTLISTLGSYSNPSSFLGKIQSLFSDFNISDFSYDLNKKIEDKYALVIQNTTGFSPFLVCQTYDCGIIKDADIFVVSKSSGIHNQNFKSEITDELSATTITNFFSENHKYIKIFPTDSISSDLQDPINRYPFAYANPEVYFNLEPKTDTSILIRTYTKVSTLNIGTGAIAGTVQVYKNGVLDIGAKFDSSTGNITLSSTVNSTDRIYITWQEDSSDFGGGALVAGAGFNYLFNPNLHTNLAITSRWPVTPLRKYTTVENEQKSFTAVSGGIEFSKGHFNLKDKLSLALENQNGSGNLLASTQGENVTKTYYLSSSSGYKTLAVPVLNIPSKLELKPDNNCTLNLRAAQTEANSITGYKIPLDFDFSKSSSDDFYWAAVDVELSSGSLLKNSSQVEIALKNSKNMTGYEYYIQLGIKAEKNFSGEDSNQIPTWKINDKNTDGLFDFSKTEWQTVTLQLNDFSRSKLSSYHDARLIIVKRPDAHIESENGTVYFGPYEPYTQLLFTKADSNIIINTQSLTGQSPSTADLMINQNYSAVLNWNYTDEKPEQPDNTKIISAKYFTSADFSNYKTINLDFAYLYSSELSYSKLSEENQFELILDNSAENIDNEGNIALKLQIKDISPYLNKTLSYHTLTIDVSTKQIYIDKELLSSAAYTLEINTNVVPDRQKITFETCINNRLISKGSFYVDNLYYKETSPALIAQNNFNATYSNKGSLIKIKNYDLLKNLELNINSTQNAQTFVSNQENKSAQITASGKTSFTLADITFVADANLFISPAKQEFLQNAGHNIKTEKPLFNIISLNESYRFSKTDSSLKKSDSATVDFSSLKIPLKFDFSAASSEAYSYQNQNASFAININPVIGKSAFTFNTSLKADQKINQLITKNYSDTNNYFQGFYDISALEFSLGKENAQKRNVNFSSKLGFSLPWKKLNPAIEYNLTSSYINSSEVTLNDSHIIKFSLPFTFANSSLSFTYTKTAVGLQNTLAKGNYISDSQEILNNFDNRTYFYTSIPFYDLFEKEVSSKLNPESTDNISNTLSSKYELLWKRKLNNSISDFFIPSATSLALSRDISYSEKVTDLYQIKAILTNNAINIFGNKSSLKLFKWYEHEEFQSSLTALVKVPFNKAEETTFQATVYTQALFFISDRNILQTGMDFSIASDLDWSFRTTLIWQKNGKTTFIIPLLNLIKPISDSNPRWKISRKETLNIQIGRKDMLNNQLYEAFHNIDLNFFENFTITAGAGATFNYIENNTNTISVKFTVGGKMQF